MATAILIVANDKTVSATLAALFNRKQFAVREVRSGRQALLHSKTFKPDVVIVDSTYARLNSRRLCRTLHNETRAVIIALVNSQTKGEQLKEADHYVLKSAIPRKFVQRVKSALNGRPPRRMRCGALTLDLEKKVVLRGKKSRNLTPKEVQLLKLLMAHADQIVTREMIMREIWDTDYLGDTRTLDVHIRWLREKIEDNASKPERLVTVRGEGYRLQAKSRE